MGQTAHPGRADRRRAPATAALLGLVAASPLLAGCGGSLASATTSLAGVVDAQVVHPDGSVVSAVDGLRLRRGDIVRTGHAGRAELHTRNRVVYAGSQASVQVVDGATDDLRHGAVVIDAQHGPGLSLTVAGLTVTAPAGTATRAERGVTIRVGALAGAPSIQSDTGRELTLAPLSQVVVGGDALPNTSADTPLRLTDDDGEARAVPLLVRDDLALDALAAGIDSTGTQTFQVVTAAWHSQLEPLPIGVARSEQVLPVVIAAATGRDAGSRYRDAVGLREAGGSWGVVAHRLGTNSEQVLAALQVFEHGAATGQVGSVPAALSFVAGGVQQGGNGGSSAHAPGSSSGNGSGSSSHPTPSPSPSSTSSPGVVTTTIDKVLSLLPTPLPTPTSLLPTVSVPLPLPSVPSLPVVGNVVSSTPLPILRH